VYQDGISTAPGIVRREPLSFFHLKASYSVFLLPEFVAMPLGKGYTVEGQVTGEEVRLSPVLPTIHFRLDL